MRVDMTPKEYQAYVKRMQKKSPLGKDMALAFVIGGLICVAGQAIGDGFRAAGRAEVFFECRLSPWDFAAGSLLVQEAGGCVTTLEGTTIDPLRPGSVFAANALCGGLTAELPRG